MRCLARAALLPPVFSISRVVGLCLGAVLSLLPAVPAANTPPPPGPPPPNETTIRAFSDAVRLNNLAAVQRHLQADPRLATTPGQYSPLPIDRVDWTQPPDVLKLLIANGAVANPPAPDGRTPLLHAAECGLWQNWPAAAANADEMFNAAYTDWSVGYGYDWNPWSRISREANLETVQVLLDHGADMHRPWKLGNISDLTPLEISAAHDYPDLLNLFLRNGADVTAPRANDSTLLHIAAECGGCETIQALLDRGLDINAADDHGRTPLFYAAMSNCCVVVQYLIDHGARTDLTDDRGRTPLHYILFDLGGQAEAKFHLLIARGVPYTADHDGRTPFYAFVGHLPVSHQGSFGPFPNPPIPYRTFLYHYEQWLSSPLLAVLTLLGLLAASVIIRRRRALQEPSAPVTLPATLGRSDPHSLPATEQVLLLRRLATIQCLRQRLLSGVAVAGLTLLICFIDPYLRTMLGARAVLILVLVLFWLQLCSVAMLRAAHPWWVLNGGQLNALSSLALAAGNGGIAWLYWDFLDDGWMAVFFAGLSVAAAVTLILAIRLAWSAGRIHRVLRKKAAPTTRPPAEPDLTGPAGATPGTWDEAPTGDSLRRG